MRGPYQPLEYAAISSRLLSCVVDIALVCGVWAAALIVGLIAMMTVASTETRGNMGAWFLVFYAIALGMIVVLSLYSVFAWSETAKRSERRQPDQGSWPPTANDSEWAERS